MELDLLCGRYTRMIGLARYTISLQENLARTGTNFSVIYPSYSPPVRWLHALAKPFGYDVKSFFTVFPLTASFNQEAVKHFTTQQMASLYFFQGGLSKVVITVHDIVPYMMRDQPDQSNYQNIFELWIDHLAMHNLTKADFIIAISSFTKDMLIKKLKCDPAKVKVVLYGLDHQLFRPAGVTEAFYDQYGLDPADRYLLYVGSENPRKNLARLFQAFARIKEIFPSVHLLKIGTPEYMTQFAQLETLCKELDISDSIHFINHPPQEDLVRFYNLAEIFLFPSLYEGFGMPPLEAMACGTPVICSNASSLPEVVGEAAILVDPMDIEAWVEAIGDLLDNRALRDELHEKSLDRAWEFTWKRTAEETLAVYETVNCEYSS
jgi:glycosyltransferase involved in cell wall biosynthesis